MVHMLWKRTGLLLMCYIVEDIREKLTTRSGGGDGCDEHPCLHVGFIRVLEFLYRI